MTHRDPTPETTRTAPHRHRRARKADFEGKTVKLFRPSADNIWRIWFTDGTSFAIQAEQIGGIPFMELCNVCVED